MTSLPKWQPLQDRVLARLDLAVSSRAAHDEGQRKSLYVVAGGYDISDIGMDKGTLTVYLAKLPDDVQSGDMLRITGPHALDFILPFSDRYLETPAVQVNQVGYSPQARERWADAGRLRTRVDLRAAVIEGATLRARPLLMTVASDAIGLLPIMWFAGTGSEAMRRVAAPMVGGVLTATVVTLLLLPVIYLLWHARRLPAAPRAPGGGEGSD